MKIKLCLVTALWQRKELSEFVLNYYKDIKKELSKDIDLTLCAVGSEGKKTKSLCERYGWEYVEAENKPLNKKFNKVIFLAKKFKPDGVILIGSDNLLNIKLFDYYKTIAKNNKRKIYASGVLDSYIYDKCNNNFLHFKGYSFSRDPKREGEPVGAGRFFSKTLLNKLDWKLWDDTEGINSGLDRNCLNRLSKYGIRFHTYSSTDFDGIVFGISTGSKITSFDKKRPGIEEIKDRDRIYSKMNITHDKVNNLFCSNEINDYVLLNEPGNIKATVAFPVFRGRRIAWLGLESLCRQQKVNFDWELIVAEEKNENYMGRAYLKKYIDRLKTKGCKRILYVSLDKWIPLSEKWRLIAIKADHRSKTYILQPADDYSEPLRLRKAHRAILDGADWHHYRYGIFHSLRLRKSLRFDLMSFKSDVKTGVFMSMRTQDVKQLPKTDKFKGVDGWLYRHLESLKNSPLADKLEDSIAWKHSLITDDANVISVERKNYYNNVVIPFTELNLKLRDILPKKLVGRLVSVKGGITDGPAVEELYKEYLIRHNEIVVEDKKKKVEFDITLYEKKRKRKKKVSVF